jgi:hypothetical protein
MARKPEDRQSTAMSPDIDEVWGFIKPFFLVRATIDFIVWIDEDLDVDWKTKTAWDEATHERDKRNAILSRGGAIEASDWDRSDRQRTLQFKRYIAEAYAACFEHDFENGQLLLDKAEEYRSGMLVRRQTAIKDQISIRDGWKKCHNIWIVSHYVIGIAALIGSTLIAARATEFGINNAILAAVAWLVAVLTGLLTFLSPEKKADRYLRAWAILNAEITRYDADYACTINDVLDACQREQNIIFDHAGAIGRRLPK